MSSPTGMAISAETDDRHRGVLQMLENAGRHTGFAAPVGGGEDVGERLVQEVHDAALARAHGVMALPASMIRMSMTRASRKIAMMPAMIWSLLSA